MKFSFTFSDGGLLKVFQQAASSGKGRAILRQRLENVANGILQRALEKVPRGLTGALAASGTMTSFTKNRAPAIRVGFNVVYATMQDWPRELGPGPVVIRPKVKSILYIPLTTRGRREYSYGFNPAEKGLIRGQDYILSMRARIPVKKYGAHHGPNKYFSETWRRSIPSIYSELWNLPFDLMALKTGRRPTTKLRAKSRTKTRFKVKIGRARFGRARYTGTGFTITSHRHGIGYHVKTK